MTTEELRVEYAKQREREGFEDIVKEYLRVRDMIRDVGIGELNWDEASEIAMLICRANGTFDRDPVRGRGVGI